MRRVAAGSIEWQPSFLGFEIDGGESPEAGGSGGPGGSGGVAGALAAGVQRLERRPLGEGAWLDQAPRVVPGPDALFEEVLRAAPWAMHERPMYDRMVVEPRLTTRRWADPPAVLLALADVLSERYRIDLRAISANLYRNGADSVAWHGDRIRHRGGETVVAIVSLGGARRFLMRPRSGGPSIRLVPASGDLLVMGGTCQRTWEHAVPKCTSAPPRISIMFRESDG